ncbi:hypothetical protein [[Mycoplasma] imitans]|uniref:hypothetical protein n=1 Tax=[Mycoplasma] imitans TaxID=29560 RepID=UPI000487CF3C|nr:hypothetical protein [[Mycoplasma] imitans]
MELEKESMRRGLDNDLNSFLSATSSVPNKDSKTANLDINKIKTEVANAVLENLNNDKLEQQIKHTDRFVNKVHKQLSFSLSYIY